MKYLFACMILNFLLFPVVLSQDYYFEPPPERTFLNQIKIFAAASLPVDEFASNDITSVNSGFAKLGFGGGLEYTHEFVKGFGFSVTGLVNAYGQDESGWKKEFPYFTFEGDNRLVVMGMGGFLFDADLSSVINLYSVGQAGVLFANYPDLQVLDAYGNQAKLTAPMASTIGYRFGLGGRSKRYDISVSYIYGNPEYQPTYQYASTKTQYPAEKKPVKALQLMLGIILN